VTARSDRSYTNEVYVTRAISILADSGAGGRTFTDSDARIRSRSHHQPGIRTQVFRDESRGTVLLLAVSHQDNRIVDRGVVADTVAVFRRVETRGRRAYERGGNLPPVPTHDGKSLSVVHAWFQPAGLFARPTGGRFDCQMQSALATAIQLPFLAFTI